MMGGHNVGSKVEEYAGKENLLLMSLIQTENAFPLENNKTNDHNN